MRNYSLDILKFLCAVLVVLLHIKTPWTEYILPITRAAVPCFFIISGYFLYQEDEQSLQRIKRSFVKVGTILLWSSVLYALFKLITTSINISYRDIIDFVLFNVNPFGYHLWYLSAYMYVLVIFYILLVSRCSSFLSVCLSIYFRTETATTTSILIRYYPIHIPLASRCRICYI